MLGHMKLRALTPLLVAVLAVAGCGGGSSGGGDGKASDSGSAAPTATPTPDPGLATVEYQGGAIALDGWRVRIDSLRRSGPFMTLNATVRCVKPAEDSTDCTSQSAFAGFEGDNNVFAGVVAVDTSGQRVYTPAREQGGATFAAPYASELEPRMEPAGPARRVWARYAAPPAEVQAMDLLLPQGGPRIADVPLSDGGVDTEPAVEGEQAATPAEFDRPPESTDAAGLDLGDYDVIARRTSKRKQTEDKRGRRVVTLAADVLFDFDKATLGPDGAQSLDEVADEVADSASTGPIAIDGYTDSKGSDGYNRALSQRRADTVREVLAGRLDGRELRAVGRGEADPVAPNTKNGADNPAGRAKNRRVTVGYTLARKDPEPKEEATPTPTPDAASAPQAASWDYRGQGTDDQAQFEVRPLGVRRTGNLSVLDLDVRCVQSTVDDCGRQFVLAREREGGNDAGAVTLVDPAQDTTYRSAVYREGGRDSLGTTVLFAPGATRRLSVYFAAVPESTSAVTVQLPNGGPRFTGVPVA